MGTCPDVPVFNILMRTIVIFFGAIVVVKELGHYDSWPYSSAVKCGILIALAAVLAVIVVSATLGIVWLWHRLRGTEKK